MQSISQMNKRLSQLNSLFTQSTSQFIYSINLHQSKFTKNDFNDFQNLITSIKQQINHKIQNFFQQKFQSHSQNYQHKINKYTQNAEQLHFQLFSFRTQLEKHTMNLKQQQHRNQIILDHFSKKFYLNTIKKKYLYAFKKNVELNKQQGLVYSEAANMYRKNLIKKVFFPWRSLTYKDGHQNKIIQQTQYDIQNIHTQYSSIINLLKKKIQDTDQLIKLKKAAKGQFAYALSKNLMKTISNLSLQVMSLNQMSIRDQQCQKSSQNQILMKQIDKVIDQKIKKVNQYKQNLLGDNTERGQKQRKIRFI